MEFVEVFVRKYPKRKHTAEDVLTVNVLDDRLLCFQLLADFIPCPRVPEFFVWVSIGGFPRQVPRTHT